MYTVYRLQIWHRGWARMDTLIVQLGYPSEPTPKEYMTGFPACIRMTNEKNIPRYTLSICLISDIACGAHVVRMSFALWFAWTNEGVKALNYPAARNRKFRVPLNFSCDKK